MQANLELWQQHMQLWQGVWQRLMGQAAQPVIHLRGDRRFRDPEWDANPPFDFIKQSYLITSAGWSAPWPREGSMSTARKLDFYTRHSRTRSRQQFSLDQPEVLWATLASHGGAWRRAAISAATSTAPGLAAITMTDPAAFGARPQHRGDPGQSYSRMISSS